MECDKGYYIQKMKIKSHWMSIKIMISYNTMWRCTYILIHLVCTSWLFNMTFKNITILSSWPIKTFYRVWYFPLSTAIVLRGYALYLMTAVYVFGRWFSRMTKSKLELFPLMHGGAVIVDYCMYSMVIQHVCGMSKCWTIVLCL